MLNIAKPRPFHLRKPEPQPTLDVARMLEMMNERWQEILTTPWQPVIRRPWTIQQPYTYPNTITGGNLWIDGQTTTTSGNYIYYDQGSSVTSTNVIYTTSTGIWHDGTRGE
jgi:hypothetical protein